jgi:hypothetical protein
MQEANYQNQSDAANAAGHGINKALDDRRYSRRLALRLPIEVCGESPFNPQTFHRRTRDIAVNGVYILLRGSIYGGPVALCHDEIVR